MAVENKYVNADIAAGELAPTRFSQGTKAITVIQTFEVAAADSDASVYRVFANLPSTLVPIDLKVLNDAMTGSTDWDFGLYEPGVGGAEVSKALLADGLDLSSGHVVTTALGGLSNVNISDLGKPLWELAGKTIQNRQASYDLAATANTVGSAAGTVTVIGTFLNP